MGERSARRRQDAYPQLTASAGRNPEPHDYETAFKRGAVVGPSAGGVPCGSESAGGAAPTWPCAFNPPSIDSLGTGQYAECEEGDWEDSVSLRRFLWGSQKVNGGRD